MKTYIGVKIVKAEPAPCQKDDFKSKVGDPGYKIQYKDGYVSWSPQKQFEDANRPMDGMTFGMAIEAMKKGYLVNRKGWNGKNQYIQLQTPDEQSKMSLPYIFICTVQGDLVPWSASQTDILSEDWKIA